LLVSHTGDALLTWVTNGAGAVVELVREGLR
jgi:hypothetical protein